MLSLLTVVWTFTYAFPAFRAATSAAGTVHMTPRSMEEGAPAEMAHDCRKHIIRKKAFYTQIHFREYYVKRTHHGAIDANRAVVHVHGGHRGHVRDLHANVVSRGRGDHDVRNAEQGAAGGRANALSRRQCGDAVANDAAAKQQLRANFASRVGCKIRQNRRGAQCRSDESTTQEQKVKCTPAPAVWTLT